MQLHQPSYCRAWTHEAVTVLQARGASFLKKGMLRRRELFCRDGLTWNKYKREREMRKGAAWRVGSSDFRCRVRVSAWELLTGLRGVGRKNLMLDTTQEHKYLASGRPLISSGGSMSAQTQITLIVWGRRWGTDTLCTFFLTRPVAVHN